MKKLLTLTAVGAILAAPAVAVQKCVALNSSEAECFAAEHNSYGADWGVTCTINGTDVQIKGIAACSKNNGAQRGQTADNLIYIGYPEDSAACWCKMISPALSLWVSTGFSDSGYQGDSTSICPYDCAMICSQMLQDNSDFLDALFSNLSD